MSEITYQEFGFLELLSKIGGLYKILTIFLSFFGGIAFKMFLNYLSNKYLNTTKEEQDKQLDECYVLNKKYSELKSVENVVKKRFSFSNYLNHFDKV